MEDNHENETGHVWCAQCGDVCELSSIPQIATECSTMEGMEAGSTIEVVTEEPRKKVAELECDWSEEQTEKQAA